MASWNVCTLLDLSNTPDRPHHRTALVALELAKYNINIAVLSKTRLHEEDTLTEVGARYTFFWKGVPEGSHRTRRLCFEDPTVAEHPRTSHWQQRKADDMAYSSCKCLYTNS